MILSLGRLCWTESEDTIYSHLMIGQKAQLDLADIKVESEYPWKGSVKYQITPKAEKKFTLAVHIPGYVKESGLSITVNGDKAEYRMEKGYAYIEREWNAGDQAEITFPMEIRRVYSTVRSVDNVGCVALMRGPFVYCLETADNGEQLQALMLPRTSEIREQQETEGVLAGTVTLTMDGIREKDSAQLYSEAAPERENVTIKAVPYYIWGNREPGQMRVWIRE